ncbi:M28 family peptidase [Brotaphodocola sp.]|uniref:M28 family peptidase n=1 Tax=Brotaphodocola sp. TaxID=3073577 RepID=UPI003D7E80DC
MTLQETILKHIDIDYSYRLAKRMEQYRSNEVLGYRSAGSRAEFETGEMLKKEMESIGLSDVTKDAITVDGWEFKKAVLHFTAEDGTAHEVQLGAYQTTFVTDGPEEFELMYLGKGTASDYEGKDVTGKLVLVDINQRDEWWINYPVYQAHLKGARALIAVQCGGYGEIDDEALNAQDIAGPENAPAFSISRKDATALKQLLHVEEGVAGNESIKILLDSDTRVMRDCTTYNIVGRIPGLHPDRMVMLSAHYDSYFSGFQDDNTAIAMMLGIAKALVDSGFKPRNTIVFCAMAAEEWGVADSNFDWSTGAYEQVFTAHPEWVGKVIADLNFELPALAHGTRARIRSCYEYTQFLEDYLSELPELTRAYPEETRITAPIETWSDDFSIAISGIPSMVNDFTGGSFMETHYHSQFDNDEFYDAQVYRLHHELFALLIVALDETAVVPLCFAPVMHHAFHGLDDNDLDFSENSKHGLHSGVDASGMDLEFQISSLCDLLRIAEQKAWRDYDDLEVSNNLYRHLLNEGENAQAEELFEKARKTEKLLLDRFKKTQDALVRIDWYGNVLYPHEILLKNLKLVSGSIHALQNGKLSSALRRLYQVDNNAYAFMFDEDVYNHFTNYVLHQPKERLKWGYGRLMPHENLYGLVKSLLKKQENGETDYEDEIRQLTSIRDNQHKLLAETLEELSRLVKTVFL